jgi:hypothetical protein
VSAVTGWSWARGEISCTGSDRVASSLGADDVEDDRESCDVGGKAVCSGLAAGWGAKLGSGR